MIFAPEYVRYYAGKTQRKVYAKFLEAVDRALALGHVVKLDFSKTIQLFPCGLLVLMSTVDQWLKKYPHLLKASYPKNELVEQILQHVNILQKLGLQPRKTISHNDVTRWHYFTGTNVDASSVEPFLNRVRSLVGEEKQMGLADCINEAMTNVIHHAYKNLGHSDDGAQWWMFATISESFGDRQIFVAMHDCGATISATLLEKPEVWDYLTGRIWRLGRADGRLIAAASEGRTSTKLPYRGKGLPEMLNFTRSVTDGELAIYSRNGFYQYLSNRNHESIGKLVKPIKGTLIVWMLNLPEKTPS